MLLLQGCQKIVAEPMTITGSIGVVTGGWVGMPMAACVRAYVCPCARVCDCAGPLECVSALVRKCNCMHACARVCLCV